LLKTQIILVHIKSDSHKILNKYLRAHYIILQISGHFYYWSNSCTGVGIAQSVLCLG